MNQPYSLQYSARRPLGISLFWVLCLSVFDQVEAQAYSSPTGDMLLCESSAASSINEAIRSQVQGILVESYVKVGDSVKKGQILGHTELDATKLQLDLAKHAMETTSNVEAAKGQADAWTATREETEEAVKRRDMEQTRLEWARSMESMHHGNYQVQLDAEKQQVIHYEHWKQQYEKRFFIASVDGIISEIKVEIGKPVNFATHIYTIKNDDTLSIPVTVPAEIADAAATHKALPIRTADGKATSEAKIDSVSNDPRHVGEKTIRLLVSLKDFPSKLRAKLAGMKFGVLLPQVASLDRSLE